MPTSAPSSRRRKGMAARSRGRVYLYGQERFAEAWAATWAPPEAEVEAFRPRCEVSVLFLSLFEALRSFETHAEALLCSLANRRLCSMWSGHGLASHPGGLSRNLVHVRCSLCTVASPRRAQSGFLLGSQLQGSGTGTPRGRWQHIAEPGRFVSRSLPAARVFQLPQFGRCRDCHAKEFRGFAVAGATSNAYEEVFSLLMRKLARRCRG